MTLCRLIAPSWLANTGAAKALEGLYTDEQLKAYNEMGYNVYYLPNGPIEYNPDETLDGTHIDDWRLVFVDMDLKDGKYASKDAFLAAIFVDTLPIPTRVVDSGNGVHVYWRVTDLDAKSYLRFQRRLMRLLNTDPAVGQIFQLMRLPGYLNTKDQANLKPCEELFSSEAAYTAEELDKLIPPITKADEAYCEQHYNRTYGLGEQTYGIDEQMPPKWGKLVSENAEVKRLWASGNTTDRSSDDFRLGHLLFANGFTPAEAITVLGNSAKALTRAPVHRQSYAENIVNKIWTFELTGDCPKLSNSVKDILNRPKDTIKGKPFRCHPAVDNTEGGFKLGQVLGLVAGSGVGKTAFAMNMFRWFSENNPDCHHFFVPLEQPDEEIAERWATISGEDTSLNEKVHIISNYDENGAFRHLSFEDIENYIIKWKETTGLAAGCVVIDHIGALKKKSKDGESQGITDICHQMKAFAVKTNTFLIMQSQTNREKAGIGDLELNKDAAYGTVFFEAYCDFLVTLWQPLKRVHSDPACPTVTAFKFCKIRHKKARKDVIQEDKPYYLLFDSNTERMRNLTQQEKVSFEYFLPLATNKRKADRKTELLQYSEVMWERKSKEDTANGTNINHH